MPLAVAQCSYKLNGVEIGPHRHAATWTRSSTDKSAALRTRRLQVRILPSPLEGCPSGKGPGC